MQQVDHSLALLLFNELLESGDPLTAAAGDQDLDGTILAEQRDTDLVGPIAYSCCSA
jgi:hypothetical protein